MSPSTETPTETQEPCQPAAKRSGYRRFLRKRYLAGSSLLLVLLYVALHLWPRSELISPAASALYVDRHGAYLCESECERLGFWDVGLGGERISQALIAIEDKRFYGHGGVDLHAIARSLNNNLRARPRQGASTLAMQVARMQSEDGERGYLQKLDEMAVAWLMTQRHGRKAVLHHYLKIVPQGNRMHGVAYAARRYFQKPLCDLSWAESAILAALPKAPGRMNLYRPSGRAHACARAELILDTLAKNGQLKASDLREAKTQLSELFIPAREIRPYIAYHAILRLNQLPLQKNYSGPVKTTLDLELQERLDRMTYAAMQQFRPAGSGNIAAVLLSRKQGDVLAYIGSDFYGDATNAGSIDYANTPRSSGSTLKPFIYALGLEDHKYTAASVVDDLPLHLTHKSGQYTAANYDGDYLGPMLYSRALANSRNIPALTVLRQVGQRRTYERLLEVGLGDPSLPAEHFGLGLAIGGMYVTLFDLVQAYGCLANDGHAYASRWLLSQEGGPSQRRVFPENSAREVTQFLADPGARLPSFPQLEFPFPVAIKTGTSQGFRDAWAVAISDEYILGVWTGHPDNLPMNQLGGMDVARLVRDIIMNLQPEQVRGFDERGFPRAEGYAPATICALTGELAPPSCEEAVEIWLSQKDLPQRLSAAHVTCAIDRRTGGAATALTAATDISLVNFIRLDPRYAVWAKMRGITPPPATDETNQTAEISVSAPVAGGRFRIDPDQPERFQTLALTATVRPTVPEVDWYVDGIKLARVSYPYTVRWPMKTGDHAIQVRFPKADIVSEPITITVN